MHELRKILTSLFNSLLNYKKYRSGSSFKLLGLTFSSKLDLGSDIISLAKTASSKIGALFYFMKFLSPEVALYLYKSTMCACMEYCCHVWASVPSCYLELLDKLKEQICKTVEPSLAAYLEPLAHHLFILIDCMIFLSPFLDVKRISMSKISFLAQLDSGIFCL